MARTGPLEVTALLAHNADVPITRMLALEPLLAGKIGLHTWAPGPGSANVTGLGPARKKVVICRNGRSGSVYGRRGVALSINVIGGGAPGEWFANLEDRPAG
jgi:hypothetical protein